MTRILTSADVEHLLSGAEAFGQLRAALVRAHAGVSAGRVLQPVPHQLGDPALDPADRAAVVPMLAHDLESGLFVVKVLADAPANRARGLPAQRSSVAVFDGATGACAGLIDGRALTRIRTAAVTALATELLTAEDGTAEAAEVAEAAVLPVAAIGAAARLTDGTAAAAALASGRVLALLGAGPLAVEHALALTRVRAFARVVVWSRTPARAESAAAQIRAGLGDRAAAAPASSGVARREDRAAAGSAGLAGSAGRPPEVLTAASAEEAVRAAAVVCTLTPSARPYLRPEWLRPGALVNAVGSPPRPHFSELLPQVFARSALTVVDTRAVAVGESGNIRGALEAGVLEVETLVELGDLMGDGAGSPALGLSADAVRVFSSVGVGAQDLAAARLVLRRAEEDGRGSVVSLRD